MVKKNTIFPYTPSHTDPDTRERIFVQRHQLLKRVVGWCEESMLTGNKHHLLFIGPRGCGKTHLVSMVHDRLTKNQKLANKMRMVWLGEDSVFTGLIDLALEIADELSNKYPDEFACDYREMAKLLSPNEAAELMLSEIVRRLKGKSILLILENLDRAFHGLGDLGQKKWRAFLQENCCVSTLATSQQLFKDVSSRSAAFYGFFEITHLEPLSIVEAKELMVNIARENGKDDLQKFLMTPEGRYRVRALHHLAGGNHRLYIMLSEFITKESLDDLITSFEILAEELTPYFQERMSSLSPQQARIVQSLCAVEGAMTVKEISIDAFISERNVSRQLGTLKKLRYVVSEKRGKESYYEMAEPLMRLCLEVKKQRGKPLKLVVDFLSAWYSSDVLKVSSEQRDPQRLFDQSRMFAYKKSALQSNDRLRDQIGQKLASELQSATDGKQFDKAMEVAEEIQYADRRTGKSFKSMVLRENEVLDYALTEAEKLLSSSELNINQKIIALRNRALIYEKLGNFNKAIADYTSIVDMKDASERQKVEALLCRGFTYGELSESEKEITDYTTVIEMEGVHSVPQGRSLLYRAERFWNLRKFERALKDYFEVTELVGVSPDSRTGALFGIPKAMIPMKSPEEALASIQRAFAEGDPKTSSFGGRSRDFIAMILERQHHFWPELIQGITLIYLKQQSLTALGIGLTESIVELDKGILTKDQLDQWHALWLEYGQMHKELSISLSALGASVQVIKTGKDRPLFKLPLEVRKIIRPLLVNSIPEKNQNTISS